MTVRKKKVAYSPAFAAIEEESVSVADPNVPQILPDQIEFVAGANVKDGYYRLDVRQGAKYTLSRRDVLNLYSVCPSAIPGDLRKRVELWNMGR